MFVEATQWLSTSLLYLSLSVTIFLAMMKFLSIRKKAQNGLNIEENETPQNAEVIIIGCGVVGSALGITLARDGRKVIIVERDMREPDRIVGELLQPGGVELLKKLNLEHCMEGIDSPNIDGYAVFRNGKEVVLNYPEIKNEQGKKFVPSGRSFHHGRFIVSLRNEVEKEKNITVIEGSVTDLIYDKLNPNKVIGLNYQQNQITTGVFAPLVVITDGVFSKFRKDITDKKPIVNSSFAGFVLKNVALPYPNRGHVILAEPSPILCYPISSDCVRILIDIPHPLPSTSDLENYLRTVSAPQMPPAIQEAFLKELDVSRVRSMPCSRLHPHYYQKEGVLLIGDAWNMRHPLTGGGMTVGFSDVILLRDLFRKEKAITSASLRNIKKDFFNQRVKHVATINVLAEALYRVFSNYDAGLLPMRDAAFAYFKLGGEAVRGTTSLLGCVNTNPWVLISHFFIVAVYGMIRTLLPFPTPSKIFLTIRTLYSSVVLLLPLVFQEHLFLPNFEPLTLPITLSF